jgi:hypothetical protein
MIGALLGDLVPWIIGAMVALAGVWGYGRSQKTQGRKDAEVKGLKDSNERQERGRDAVHDLRDAGRDDLNDSLRQNDDKW